MLTWIMILLIVTWTVRWIKEAKVAMSSHHKEDVDSLDEHSEEDSEIK